MPEGDTIYRAAHNLHTALAGQVVTRFESVFPQLTRVDVDSPIAGRTVEHVTSRGKHLLMVFERGLVLRTHMRMHGSWHIYRPGERWQRPRHELRIRIATAPFEALAFAVPIAEFITAAELDTAEALHDLGPDPLSDAFDPAEAGARLATRGDLEIADALLDQRVMAGIGNVFKSEILFMARISPFVTVAELPPGQLAHLVQLSVKVMRANVADLKDAAVSSYSGYRRTTGRTDPSASLWVYGRGRQPCRRCGTPIQRVKQGPDSRSTYWCERCQPRTPRDGGVRAIDTA